VVEQVTKIMMVVVIAMMVIKFSDLEKKKEKKQNGLKAKVKSIGPFCFGG
jgi:hypothetical protein